MEIEKFRNQLYWCNKCGYCRDTISDELGFYGVCPIYEVKRFEHYSPRGRATIALAILEGVVEMKQSLIDIVYSCLTCGICTEICPSSVNEGVDVAEIVKALRRDLVKAGFKPPNPLPQIDENVAKTGNVFGETPSNRVDWSRSFELEAKGENLYFAGCYASYRFPETARSTVKLLEKAGLKVAYLGENELCCGLPELWDGNLKLARELVERNMKTIRDSGVKRIITSCAGCYHTFKSEYKKILGSLPVEVHHVSEVLLDLVRRGKLEVKKSIENVMTYHDPCHLGRHEKIYDQPRTLLKAISRTELREMKRSREKSWCCGGGAIVSTVYPEITRRIADWRIQEALETGAEIIVTSCPLCQTILRRAASPKGIKVYDLPVILAEALNIPLD